MLHALAVLLSLSFLGFVGFSIVNIIYPLGFKIIKTRKQALLYLILSFVAFPIAIVNIAESPKSITETNNTEITESTTKANQWNTETKIDAGNNIVTKTSKLFPDIKLKTRTTPPVKTPKYKFYKYTKKSNPRTWRDWGPTNVKKINRLRKQAALIVQQSRKCDDVIMSELSDNRSMIRSQIVLFIDCFNDERFYMTEQQIKQKQAAISESQSTAALSNTTVLTACRTAIKFRLKFPSSYDENLLGSGVNRGPVGNLLVSIDFEAKNGIGIDLPQRGLCYIDSRGLHTVEISKR